MTDSPFTSSHQPRKRFGQNFLHDKNIIEKIIYAIDSKESDTLVEIGPGQGAITDYLQSQCKTLHVIEIDRDLAALLSEKYQQQNHIHIHQADALNFNFSTISNSANSTEENTSPTSEFRVVGNLPYNISTPLLIKLIDFYPYLKDAHFMLQKEVVDRICAAPGNKTYGRLSIILQYYFSTEHLFNVPPQAFFPAPKVDSAIIRLRKRKPTIKAENLKEFHKLCRNAFAQRRKTLRNNLKNAYTQEQVAAIEPLFDLKRRPETLSVDEFIALSNAISGHHTQ